MENINLTSINYFSVLLMNESEAIFNKLPTIAVEVAFLAYVKSIQELFPTWITNIMFNIIYAFGVLANSVLVMYLIYYKRYQAPVFCVMLSLGVSDLGGCLGSIIYYTMISPFILGPLWLCKVVGALTHLTYLSSSYHIVVFAVLRFIQLVYPLKSHTKVTRSLMLKVCLTIWAIHSIQAFVSIYYLMPVNISTREGNSVYACWFTGSQQILIPWVIVFWCSVPFLTTSGFHIAKQVVVMTSHSANVTSQEERGQQLRRQTDSRALAIVIITYLITIVPYIVQAFRVYVLNITHNPIQVFLVELFDQLAYSNSAINPWIYLFAAESVRSDIKNMLSCNIT